MENYPDKYKAGLDQSQPLCDDVFQSFMNSWDLTRRVTRVYCFVVITIQSILMVYLASFIFRFRKQKITTFTALMLLTIGLGLVIGFAEAITFLVATNIDQSRNYRAEKFIFYGCGLPLSLLTDIQNFIEWITALLLAHKYHIVALTIESVTQTGNFLKNATKRKLFWLYIGLVVSYAFQIIIEEPLIWVQTENGDVTSLRRTITSNSILSVFYLAILTVLFAYSYFKIMRTLKVA